MVSPRRMIAVAGAAGVVLATVLTGSAGAATDPTVPSCQDATASLAQARLIVSGVDGKGGTAGRLAAAQKADEKARTTLHDDLALDATEDTDYGTPGADTQDTALNAALTERDNANQALINANNLPSDTKLISDHTSKAYIVQQAQLRQSNALGAIGPLQQQDAAEDGIGVEENPHDQQDLKVAADRVVINGTSGTAAALKTAQDAEGSAEQGVVDAEEVAGKACPPASNGTNGTNGKDGKDGKDGTNGIDARIVLSPGVCADASVQPGDVQRLIRVVALIPCPVSTPPAPSTPPVVGSPVVVCPPNSTPAQPVVISPALPSDGSAPTPVPVQASLPVTG